jgi:drug/metabolite transporter (DMT)-like permease
MDDRAPSEPIQDDNSAEFPVEAETLSPPGIDAAVAPAPSAPAAVPAYVHKDQPLLGMAAAVGAFLMLSTMSLLAKLLSARHGVIEIAFWRNLIGAMPFLALIVAFGRRDILKIQSKPGVVLSRSVIATGSVMCLFGAFSYLPMADATALIFTSALFVPVFGFFFLGERVGVYRWSAILVGFAGVLVIAQPTGGWNLTGVIFALAAAVLNAVLGTMLRLLGRTERQDTLTFYLLFTGMLLLAPFMPFVATMPAPDEIGLILAIGLCGVCMQLLLSTAFKYTPAALASLFSYTQIIWATLFGFVIFGDVPGWNIAVGASIIVTASVFVVLRESYLARKGRLPRPPGPATD